MILNINFMIIRFIPILNEMPLVQHVNDDINSIFRDSSEKYGNTIDAEESDRTISGMDSHRRRLRFPATGRPELMECVYSSQEFSSIWWQKNDVHKWRCQRWAVHFVWYWLQNCEYRCRLNHQFVLRWVRDANNLQGLSLLLPERFLKTSEM